MRPGTSAHDECWLLLPWLANGRLSAAPRARAEEHVSECAQCARELEAQRLLCAALTEPERITYAPGPAFRKLMARIDGAQRPAAPVRVPARVGARATLALGAAWRPPGLAWAATFALTVGLGILVATAYRWSQPSYLTVTSDARAAPDVLHIAFERSLPVGDVAGAAALGGRAHRRGSGQQRRLRDHPGRCLRRARRPRQPRDACAGRAAERRPARALDRAARPAALTRACPRSEQPGSVKMRTLAQLAALACSRCSPPWQAPASRRTRAALPRIVVAFANEPHSAPGPAGTTGSHYVGGGYHVSQSAQRQAHRVARTYALRALPSWPIEALSMHCVVYEITDGRAVSEVLARLAKDSGVVLAQPLQEFHTLTGAPPRQRRLQRPALRPADQSHGTRHRARPRAHPGPGAEGRAHRYRGRRPHPDLRGRILRSHSYLPDGIRRRLPAPRDGHGRHHRGGRQQSRRHRRHRPAGPDRGVRRLLAAGAGCGRRRLQHLHARAGARRGARLRRAAGQPEHRQARTTRCSPRSCSTE